MAVAGRDVQHSEGRATSPSPPPSHSFGGYPAELIQRLIDQAACFNLFAFSDALHAPTPMYAPYSTNNIIGIRAKAVLHRFAIDLQLPSLPGGVRAMNTLGESFGRLALRWMIIPNDIMARPDREPPPTLLQPSRSQRFAMQEATFTFGEGQDGFHSFGTGRTFPMMIGGRPKLVAAAVGNITEGFGKFRGHEGNFTLCGDLLPEQGFVGHIVVRIMDPGGNLRTQTPLPPPKVVSEPDPRTTFLMWVGQKGTGPEQENRFSFAPDGQVRGVNVPTELKRVHMDCTVHGPRGFQCSELRTGAVIGREIGFGRGSQPGAPPTGTALSPFLFEGVAQYSLFDGAGKIIGAITTNVLEGRRFDMQLTDAPGVQALRFGFFGPIVFGSGCFRAVEGMFYGVSSSVFDLPPGGHVVTHLYVARLHDPEGKFRAASNVRAEGI